MPELKYCRKKLVRLPDIERPCDDREMCTLKLYEKLVLLEQKVEKLKARLMVQAIMCGMKDNIKGTKSIKVEIVQVIIEWIHPVIGHGNKMRDIIYVKDRCVGTPVVAVNDV